VEEFILKETLVAAFLPGVDVTYSADRIADGDSNTES
jgi:hypothetical protein